MSLQVPVYMNVEDMAGLYCILMKIFSLGTYSKLKVEYY